MVVVRLLTVVLLSILPISLFARHYVPGEDYEKGEIVKADVRKLHPTQFSVGEEEVYFRKKEVRELIKNNDKKGLKKIAINVVIGPEGKLYIIDGHHHSRAFYETGNYELYVKIDKDWSDKSPREFWSAMKNLDGSRKRTRTYLKDQNGNKRSQNELPKTVGALKKNPFRSIVYKLIKAEIIKKDDDFPLYGEFKIVDWLRKRVPLRDSNGRLRMKKATEESAILLTRKKNQDYDLPGVKHMKKKKCMELLEGIEGTL